VQVGTPTDIYEYPNSRFVADFIGSVNMFAGRLIEDEPDHVRIESADLGGTVYVDHGISAPPGADVWTAIRPEKIEIGRVRPAGTDNIVRGVVKEIAYLGDMSVYLVKADSGQVLRVSQPNIERQQEDRISWDETVYLSWHASSPVILTQ
jgi:putrescine transport system ATP-binding protein